MYSQHTNMLADLPPVHILVEECIVDTTWIVELVEWSKPPVARFPLPVNSFTVYYGERKMEIPSVQLQRRRSLLVVVEVTE